MVLGATIAIVDPSSPYKHETVIDCMGSTKNIKSRYKAKIL